VLYGDRRVDELLQALARPALAGRVRLELVGNLTAETEQALAHRPPGVEVETVPPQSWEATMDRVAAADVVAVIYPRSMGDEYSVPVKLHEALALGKPVLSITAGGASEALLRELGQDHALARHGDAASVGDALERLLAGPPPAPVDPGRIARFDRARVAADYAALLDELAGG
jgi:glycosyltransferase involved in cell wall biosynthesis